MTVPVVILAGGRGARFDHESQVKPKPLIEVAGKPILGHIMDLFEAQGFDDFIILGGYLCEQVEDYVATRYECRAEIPTHSYITVFGNRDAQIKAHVLDTGIEATTGDRLWALTEDWMPRSSPFFVTYGDGLADIDLRALLAHHELMKKRLGKERIITLTAVHPPGRFGVVRFADAYHDEDRDIIRGFEEKSESDWINGGFMVFDKHVDMKYIPNKPYAVEQEHMESLEYGALPRAARDHALVAYRHESYWRCMDTRRDLEQIEADVAAANGRLPWRRDMVDEDA